MESNEQDGLDIEYYGEKTMNEKSRRAIWPWLSLGAALLLFALLFSQSAIFKNGLGVAIGWAKELMNSHPVTGALIFFVYSALSAMLAFASSAVLVPPANLVWGRGVTFLLLWGGWIAGAIAAYGIGKLAFPLLFRLGYKEKLQKYREFVSTRMKFWVALLFCVAVPSEVPGYLLGGMHYPFWKFLAAIAIAESIFAFGIVVAGESLLSADHDSLIVAVGALIVMAAAAGVMLRAVKRRRAGGVS